MARKIRKISRVKTTSNSLSKQFMLSAVHVIAEKIVDEKKKNAGRAPWGFASRLLKQGKETFPNMSKTKTQ